MTSGLGHKDLGFTFPKNLKDPEREAKKTFCHPRDLSPEALA